ncbi:MAG: hypothetical protein GWP05_05140 [Anaerolineaceae bacterium]|nr:hypothetical protein [Anaerolineaceae bacterium]
MTNNGSALVRAASVLAICLAMAAALPGCAGKTSSREINEINYVFYPSPPDAPRMQFLCRLSGSKDFARRRGGFADFVTGKRDEADTAIAKPFGIAVRGGTIYVADSQGKCIAMMDFSRQRFATFGNKGKGLLGKPINIRLDASGRLYVTDMARGQVVVFDSDGKYVAEYGGDDKLSPADVIVSGDEMYVLDIAFHGIKVFDLQTGRLKRSFGGRGKGFGEFNYPTNMVMDGEGNFYVCDSMNFRVQKIDPNGKLLLLFGEAGRTAGRFARPKGIAVDREGIIYVVDSMFAAVQLFNQEGQPLMFFGGAGSGQGQLQLPAQVTISYDIPEKFRKLVAPDFEAKYLVFVTSQLGPNKVNVYAFGQSRKPAGTQDPATDHKGKSTKQIAPQNS